MIRTDRTDRTAAVAADLAYSADIVARVHAEAAEATAMPRWFWFAAPIVFVGAVALSAVFPWGFA